MNRRVLRSLGLCGVALVPCMLAAQVVDMSASTPQQAAAYGMAEMARAAGQNNLLNSQAAINYEQARTLQLENYEQQVNTYFEARQANRSFRAAERGPRPTPEQMARFARSGAPRPLSGEQMDPISGELSWPALLQTEPFADGRDTLEGLIGKQARYGQLSFADQTQVRQTSDSMTAVLKTMVRDVPVPQYTASRNFLRSLVFAATGAPSS